MAFFSTSRVRLVGGVIAYGTGVGIAYEIARPIPPLPSCKERCCTFNQLAPGYDREIERDESSSGILDLRRQLGAQARGRVLEVAGGTGRNVPFYSSRVSSLLITDYSEPMLQQAARKVAEGTAKSGAALDRNRVTLAVVDAGALALPDKSFDTIVDTFGICSFEKPEAALQEMKRCCADDGEILLLEHGVSSWSVLKWWQQHRLNRHVVRWGCYWNRDILELVEQSGLHVRAVERRHLGTTYYLRCSPTPG